MATSMTTKGRILQAAETEFIEKGYAGARTTAIAEAAGVTHAMLHYYFRSKDKLFSRVISEKLTEISNSFIVRIDNDKPLTDCIRAAVESHFDFLRANPAIPRFMVTEVFPNPELLGRLEQKIGDIAQNTLRLLQAKIDTAAAAGLCKPVNAQSVVLDIISLNVFPILAAPLLGRLSERLTSAHSEALLDRRREENVQTIFRNLGL